MKSQPMNAMASVGKLTSAGEINLVGKVDDLRAACRSMIMHQTAWSITVFGDDRINA